MPTAQEVFEGNVQKIGLLLNEILEAFVVRDLKKRLVVRSRYRKRIFGDLLLVLPLLLL